MPAGHGVRLGDTGGTGRPGGCRALNSRAARRALAGLVSAAMLLCLGLLQSEARASGATENVFVVVIDGARYTETFGDPYHRYIPHIWRLLRPQGAISTRFYNRGETITTGAHAAMLTGSECWLESAGESHGDYSEGDLHRPFTPTLFEYFRTATGAEQSRAWVVNNHVRFLEAVTYSTHPGYGAAYGAAWHFGSGSDYRLWQEVAAIMDEYHPNLVLLNLHSTDKYGHRGDWGKYTRHILLADRVVYEIWQKIQSDPFYADRTSLFVTNDHGRHTRDFTNHGDCCEGCQHVMFLALGPDIRRGYRSGGVERHLQDIGVTAAWMLDLPMPHAVDGAVMDELFRPETQAGGTAGEPTDDAADAALAGAEVNFGGLAVTAITTNAAGQPSGIFQPGEIVGLAVTAHNPGASSLRIYEAKIGAAICHRGKSLWDPVWLAPGEYLADVAYIRVPQSAPTGEWPLEVECRALYEAGSVVTGTTTVLVTVGSP